MELVSYVRPLGIMTYSFLFLTVASGLLRKKFSYVKWFRFHRTFAILSLLMATFHAAVVIYYY